MEDALMAEIDVIGMLREVIAEADREARRPAHEAAELRAEVQRLKEQVAKIERALLSEPK
jgi:polyhydroxyalkanoate synthesis regulator phasin